MSLNSDLSKQAQAVIMTQNLQKLDFPPYILLLVPWKKLLTKKNLEMLLDFQEHCKYLLQKVTPLLKFQNVLPRPALLTIYMFCWKLPRIWLLFMINLLTVLFTNKFNPNNITIALATTGAIRGTSRETIYQELVSKSPQQRSWFWKLYFL